jgi:AraC-like DNA-binding protein
MNRTNNNLAGTKINFEIYRIGDKKENDPSVKNSFKAILVKQGTGTHLIDVNKYEITPDTIHCIVPGRLHFFNSTDADGYVLSFTSEFLDLHENSSDLFSYTGLFNTFLNSPVVKLTGQSKTEMIEIAEKMLRKSEDNFSETGDIQKELLRIFLIYFNRLAAQSKKGLSQSRNAELGSRFLMLLEKNYATDKMVADYARNLSVTPNYLNEVVKKVSGFPASYHIQQRIILEAKRKAAYVRMSMKEVAYDLGFDDISHFSKFFKNGSGINFTDFRKEISQRFCFA